MNWCKLGLHDWENVGWENTGLRMLHDAVCMNCGKIKTDAKDHKLKEKEKYLLKDARENRARELFNKKGENK